MEGRGRRPVRVQAVKKTDSLIFRFAVVFAIFTVVALTLIGIATYVLQNRMYRAQVESNISDLSEYLSCFLTDEALDFANHQKFLIEHHDEVLIPIDYDYNYAPAQQRYEALLAEEFPGMAYGQDITFDQLSDELKIARAIYIQEYCLKVFEQAAQSFNVPYCYYIVPNEDSYECCFIIDGIREERVVDGKAYIDLAMYFDEELDKVPVLWKVWDAQKAIHEFEIYNNEYGYTYAYYSPLVIDGTPLGLVTVDYEIDAVNHEILNRVFNTCAGTAIVLILCVIVLLIYINRRHIRKLENLVQNVKQYTIEKNPDIARAIAADAVGRDEISDLARRTADMILELDKYMKNLLNTTKELTETRQQAKDLQALANKDSLTGVRNKTAYDDEIRKLKREAVQGLDKFGIGIIDLNDLKTINEEFGHDKGNIAVKNLCRLVCNVFKHSPVFRIGGDQFAVILKNGDYDAVESLVNEFYIEAARNQMNDALEPWEKYSAAIGVALFDRDTDFTVNDVSKRAEANMFAKKQKMKADGK